MLKRRKCSGRKPLIYALRHIFPHLLRFFKHMDACVREIFISAPDEDNYDPRYFYFTMVNGAWQGHCQCGIVRDVMEAKITEWKEYAKSKR